MDHKHPMRTGIGSLLACCVPLGLAMADTLLPEGENNHLITVPRIIDHPRPTTDLSAEPWARAACVTGFFEAYAQRFSGQPTWVYLYYDPDTLWVAFRCEGVAGDKLVARTTERDGKVWLDDGIELFLNPGLTRRENHQFIINPKGVGYDSAGGFKSWNVGLDVQTSTDETGWTLVTGIPFATLNARPQPGQAWGINLCRFTSLPAKSRWAPAMGGLHLPQFLGQLVFGDENTRAVRFRDVASVVIGSNTFRMDHANGLGFKVVGTTETKQLHYSHEGLVTDDGRLTFDLPDDGVRHIALSVLDKQGRRLARCWYPMTSPEVSREAGEVHALLEAVAGGLDGFPAEAKSAAEKIVAESRPRFDEVTRSLKDPKRRSAENWRRLDATCKELKLRLDGPACLARTIRHYPKAAFGLGLQSPMQKVMIRDFAFDGRFGHEYKLAMARNEHEAFQVVVIPFPNDLKQATVSASPLVGRGGRQPCPGGRVRVSLVGHIEVPDNPRYDVDYHGWWPDALIDFQQSCDARAGEHVSFWIDVATSSDTPPGDYEGTITVSGAGCEPVELRLAVHVWDFELPKLTNLRNAFTYDQHAVPRFYGDKWNDAMARKYHDFLLDHRLNIDHLYRREAPAIDLLEYGVARGMNAFNLGAPFRRVGAGRSAPELDEYVDRLKHKGMYDKAYVYGYDEVHEEKFPEMRQVFRGIHQTWPGLKTMTTAYDPSFGQETDLRDAVDIWCPLTDWYDRAERDKLRAEGREMWWYVCITPIHPYANWFIEYPAIEARLLMGAMTYKYQADGFLYYLINLWRGNRQPIRQGPYTEWDPASFIENRDPHDKERITATGNGDGSLMYPGPDGPMSSIRLANIRDGIEDYDYLHLLAGIAERVRVMPDHPDRAEYLKSVEPLLAVPDSLVKSVVEYSRDPDTLSSYRVRLAGAILVGQKLLGREVGPGNN